MAAVDKEIIENAAEVIPHACGSYSYRDGI